jgi:hypothetical protein
LNVVNFVFNVLTIIRSLCVLVKTSVHFFLRVIFKIIKLLLNLFHVFVLVFDLVGIFTFRRLVRVRVTDVVVFLFVAVTLKLLENSNVVCGRTVLEALAAIVDNKNFVCAVGNVGMVDWSVGVDEVGLGWHLAIVEPKRC